MSGFEQRSVKEDDLLGGTRTKVTVGALVAVSAIAVPSAIGAPATVTIDAKVTGKQKPKLDRKRYKATSLSFGNTIADAANPAGLPPKVNQVVTKFDPKDIRFNSDAVPTCDIGQLQGTTTEAALQACGDAQVGSGTAVANLAFGTGGTRQDFDSVITAFNKAGDNGILFHARSDALGTTIILDGTLRGHTLTVSVPPIAGGVGSSSEFNVRVQAKDYIEARCKDGKINTEATFSFVDAPPASASDAQPCKRKG
jgi:hypothetical protein